MRRGWIVIAFLAAVALAQAAPELTLLDLAHDRTFSLAEAVSILRQKRIVVVGEEHTHAGHHRAQLRVIQALAESGAKVAIGLEMFRSDNQADLDRWVAGEMPAADFEKVYARNWNYPWKAYSAIFEYARARRIPMLGLNVPPEITRQVARSGFQSLSESERGALSDVTCSVDEEYMRYIREVFGAHPHGQANFTFFCEAQMVWDTAMAVHALGYLRAHPDATVVILTGVGHAQKGAVPRQVGLHAATPVSIAVLLPEIPGSIDRRTADVQDADYLITDLN
jgi:uncharacterized iron-regulated protein